PLARFAHRCSPIPAKAFAKHIPVLCPSGQPAAVQSRSRRFCRGELTEQWRKDNPALISGERRKLRPAFPAYRPSLTITVRRRCWSGSRRSGGGAVAKPKRRKENA